MTVVNKDLRGLWRRAATGSELLRAVWQRFKACGRGLGQRRGPGLWLALRGRGGVPVRAWLETGSSLQVLQVQEIWHVLFFQPASVLFLLYSLMARLVIYSAIHPSCLASSLEQLDCVTSTINCFYWKKSERQDDPQMILQAHSSGRNKPLAHKFSSSLAFHAWQQASLCTLHIRRTQAGQQGLSSWRGPNPDGPPLCEAAQSILIVIHMKRGSSLSPKALADMAHGKAKTDPSVEKTLKKQRCHSP